MRKQNGSSPIGHPKNKAAKPEKIEVQNLQVRQHLAQLSDYAPGGDNLTQQMRAQLVKLHTTGKRWYVSYYTKAPSGKQERRRSYGYVNTEKDEKKRMQLLIELQTRVYISLQNGQDFNEQQVQSEITIYKITTRMLSEKKDYLKETAYQSIKIKLNPWKEWILLSNMAVKHPTQITKVDVLNYRNWLLQKNISNRTINNYVDEVSALFNHIMRTYELINRNPCININRLPSRSESHVAYTEAEAVKISEYLMTKDPTLLFFIRLISYSFLRTKEARTLQIKHIDFINLRIMLTAQNNKVNKRVWKMIPTIFKEDFIDRNLQEYPNDYFLFGKNGKPGPINVGATFFTKRFKKVKKHFGLSAKHTLYGFRHTSVSMLLRSGKTWDDVMKLTGHTQYSSFQKYARSVGEDAPKDLSDGFTIKI